MAVPRTVAWVRVVVVALTVCLAPLILVGGVSTNIETTADPDPAWVHVCTALSFVVPFAFVYTMLSVFIGAGRQWARVATMIVLGLQLTCCGLTSVYFSVQDPLQSELVRDGQMRQANPGSLELAGMASLSAVIAILSLAGMILLLRPASSAFFRDSERQRKGRPA